MIAIAIVITRDQESLVTRSITLELGSYALCLLYIVHTLFIDWEFDVICQKTAFTRSERCWHQISEDQQ